MSIRLQFKFRSFVAVITIGCLCLGGWVAHQRHWIALRQAALAMDGIQGNPSSKHSIHDKPYSPHTLWLFGEPGQSVIHVALDRLHGEELQEMRALFPEARFVVSQPGEPLFHWPPLNP